MQYNRKMINGVVFLEEQADYLLLLGKEGLYTVQAENDHWNVHYTLPGDTSNLDKQFISKDEALQDGKYEITLYTSCCNVTKGIYYYNTYENHQISAVDMHVENLDMNLQQKIYRHISMM